MTQFLEIEGDLVRVVERSVVSTARLEDVMPLIETRIPVSLFHPRTAIYTNWDESNPAEKKVTFLCELSPSLRSITKSNRRYRLAMPWTYFIFSFESSGTAVGLQTPGRSWSITDYRVFHTNQRVTSMESRLWTAFLPNVYEDGRICFGNTGADVNAALPDRVDSLVNTWYLSAFNNDVQGGRNHPLPFNEVLPNGWRAWVDATTEHGASAWTLFPEWNAPAGDRNVTNLTVGAALGTLVARTEPMIFRDPIPELPIPATFGRVEEWVRDHTNPTTRLRLVTAMQNLIAEDPDAVATPEPTPTDEAMADDGGVPI